MGQSVCRAVAGRNLRFSGTDSHERRRKRTLRWLTFLSSRSSLKLSFRDLHGRVCGKPAIDVCHPIDVIFAYHFCYAEEKMILQFRIESFQFQAAEDFS